MAAEDASLRTVNDSMSLGLMVSRGLAIPVPASTAIGTPSMTKRGSLDAFRDAAPRIRIVELDPGPPSPGITCRPGTFPLSMSWVEVIAPRFSSSVLMAVIEPVISSFFTVPYPMTTTSSRNSASVTSLIDAGTSDALNVKVLYPIQLISTIASADDTSRAKSPSRPVEVPFVVPCSRIVAPMTGPTSSDTTPFISYPSCADMAGAVMHMIISPVQKDKILFIGSIEYWLCVIFPVFPLQTPQTLRQAAWTLRRAGAWTTRPSRSSGSLSFRRSDP